MAHVMRPEIKIAILSRYNPTPEYAELWGRDRKQRVVGQLVMPVAFAKANHKSATGSVTTTSNTTAKGSTTT